MSKENDYTTTRLSYQGRPSNPRPTRSHDTVTQPHHGRRALAAGAALVAAAGGGLYGVARINTAYHRHERANHNAAAFKNVHEQSLGTFVIKSGAHVRYEPTTADASSHGDNGNIYQTIPKDKAIVAIHPLRYDVNGNTWLGFTDGTETHTLQGRKVHTVWIDETQLSVQGLVEQLPAVDANGKPLPHQSVPVTIAHDGSITHNGTADPYAATSIELTNAQLAQFKEADLR